ncbi:TetR/AcrR family transcriptional regulator [Fulvivirga sp. 29W222]|uniref:TetR/AcrR family transcriptional regulator n=1 Tax=Fulvivirga marina TaxID=2494733 RepID=A0A937KB16_9BACT|nr:TetR/AcrR family transcriptional regulator [Fulvivirga marina]MBL6445427.1 TetR/AcrR family transcriptional regulator [Fulvivirga marina]
MTLSNRQLEIIDAAGKILTSAGVSGLTIKNLANEMGFRESAIYRHFESKEKIIVAMLNHLADTMDQKYSEVTSADAADEKFTHLFQKQFMFFKEHPHFAVAVFSDGLMKGSDTITRAIHNIMQVKVKHLTPIIEGGQKAGIFKSDISSTDLIHIVMGSVRLLMFKWRTADFKTDILITGNQLLKVLLQLIKQPN